MIGFDLTDEQRLVEQSVREWGNREVAPHIRELDRAHRFDRDRILGGMAKLGLLGVCVPQDYGGAGLDYVCLGLVSEELEYVDTSLRVIMSVHTGLNCLSLLTWGTEAQKQRYLVPQAQGRKIAGYALTEPGAGSDARAIQTTAVRQGDRYILTGEKTWISLADVADHFLVFAWTDLAKKQQRDPSGISAFIVERRFKGFSSGPMKEKWGILAGNTGFFTMDGVEVPEENMLGRAGEGFKIAMSALDQGRFTVAAGATGLIRACRDASVRYAKERTTFGVEIAQHQLVKEMVAKMESDYQAARLLWIRSAWLKNVGRRNTRETGLAKWFATVASERAAGDAVQIHGANGYSDEYPVGRFYRNCKGAVIYEGTREIHAIMQADYLLGYRDDRPARCELPPFNATGHQSPDANHRPPADH
jgi:glutaryl-CoA dehydrogenase (non-decarboxylating)